MSKADNHASSPYYARVRRAAKVVEARAAKRRPKVKAGFPPVGALVATARGAHSRGYRGVLIRDGLDVTGPCEHLHRSTEEARLCVDPLREHR